jgi:hypothetical protein
MKEHPQRNFLSLYLVAYHREKKEEEEEKKKKKTHHFFHEIVHHLIIQNNLRVEALELLERENMSMSKNLML